MEKPQKYDYERALLALKSLEGNLERLVSDWENKQKEIPELGSLANWGAWMLGFIFTGLAFAGLCLFSAIVGENQENDVAVVTIFGVTLIIYFDMILMPRLSKLLVEIDGYYGRVAQAQAETAAAEQALLEKIWSIEAESECGYLSRMALLIPDEKHYKEYRSTLLSWVDPKNISAKSYLYMIDRCKNHFESEINVIKRKDAEQCVQKAGLPEPLRTA